jgi:sugar/nucleoside kinase (ribokinase family)
VGARWIARGASSAEIGATVHAVEDASGAGDCYARALITAFMCLSARRACVLAVGVLAPTRKMHAWCCVEGDLPYEPSPEHYLYQPVWTLSLAP